MPNEPFEFDCTDCGRHVIQICGPVNEFNLCGACLIIPGWWEIPELRERLGWDDEIDKPRV